MMRKEQHSNVDGMGFTIFLESSFVVVPRGISPGTNHQTTGFLEGGCFSMYRLEELGVTLKILGVSLRYF